MSISMLKALLISSIVLNLGLVVINAKWRDVYYKLVLSNMELIKQCSPK